MVLTLDFGMIKQVIMGCKVAPADAPQCGRSGLDQKVTDLSSARAFHQNNTHKKVVWRLHSDMRLN